MVDGLDEAFDAAAADDAVKAVILAANGKHFCVGDDLEQAWTGEKFEALMKRFKEHPEEPEFIRQFEFPKPVIVAINGYCFAGALELILWCDILIAFGRRAVRNAIRPVRPDGRRCDLLPPAPPDRTRERVLHAADRRTRAGGDGSAVGLGDSRCAARSAAGRSPAIADEDRVAPVRRGDRRTRAKDCGGRCGPRSRASGTSRSSRTSSSRHCSINEMIASSAGRWAKRNQ